MDQKTPSSILIVGEDSYLSYLLRSYGRRSACQTMFFSPGDNILEIVQREHPAAIVLDMDIPARGGWNLLRELKANQATHATPVVICTWTDEQDLGAQEGANLTLRMPILFADFLEILNQIGVEVKTENV